jgi:hypothetical protein
MHHMFYQNRLQTEALDENWPLVPPSTPDLTQDELQNSVLFDLDDLQQNSDYSSALPTTFPPFSTTTLTTNDPLSFATCSDKEIAMLDLPLDDFSAESSDVFSEYIPNLPGLKNIPPKDDNSDMSSISESRNCLNSGGCCFAFASRALKYLHIPSTLCLSTIGTVDLSSGSKHIAPRPADSVLIANSEAMLALSKILLCSCSLKPQLQMIMATICDKLVAWYYAMAHGKQSFELESTVSTPECKLGSDNARKERVLCQRVKIGDYCLETAAEAQIMARVVLSHLQKMDYLIGVLSRRIKDTHKKNSSSRQQLDSRSPFYSDPSDIFGIFSDSLTAYLIGQLQDAQNDVARLIGK